MTNQNTDQRGQDARETRGRDARDTAHTRREFFAWVARGSAAAALAAVGVVLGLRGLGRAKEDPCLRSGLCRSCDRAEDCGLPQAMMFRDASERKEGPARG